MMNDACERFLADPANDPEHLEHCESCRGAMENADRALAAAARIEARPAAARLDLPLAPWEGAAARPWPLVGGAVAGVVALATLLFAAAGVSPFDGFLATLQGSVVPRAGLLDAGISFSKVLDAAPLRVHAIVGVSFVAVNFILYRLLRRPTRGYDATR